MRKLLCSTAAACLCAAVAAPDARAGDGGSAFVGGMLGGALGGVIGNAITSRPAPPPPPPREVIYVDRPPTVVERPVYRAPPPPVHDMARADLVDLQLLLNRYGAAYGFSAGVPDGVYGPATRRALSQFQSLRGLPATGIPSYPILAELRRAVQELDASPTVPTGLPRAAPAPAPAQPAAPQPPQSVEAQKIEVNVMTAAPAATLAPPAPAPQPAAGAAASVQTTSLSADAAGTAVARTKQTALASLAAPAQGAAALSRFEVAGVRLGDSPDGARKALRAFAPAARIDDVAEGGSDGQRVSRVTGVLAESAGRADRVEVWFGPEEGAADFLVRSMSFGEAGRPALATIEQGLLGKYGPAHAAGETADGRKTIAWVFDPAGNPAGQAASLCVRNVGDGFLTQPGAEARGACGLVVVADIDAPDGLVEAVILRVRDLEAYFRAQEGDAPAAQPPADDRNRGTQPGVQSVKF